MKRDASPTELAKRQRVTPAAFRGLSRSDLKSACQCSFIGDVRATVTRSVNVPVTATATINRGRIIKKISVRLSVITMGSAPILTDGPFTDTAYHRQHVYRRASHQQSRHSGGT